MVGVLLAEAGVAWAPGMARATKADTAATAATTPTARALVSRLTRARAASRRRAANFPARSDSSVRVVGGALDLTPALYEAGPYEFMNLTCSGDRTRRS